MPELDVAEELLGFWKPGLGMLRRVGYNEVIYPERECIDASSLLANFGPADAS